MVIDQVMQLVDMAEMERALIDFDQTTEIGFFLVDQLLELP